MITTQTPRALLFTTLLLLPTACSDDDSSATTEGSSTSTGQTPDPSADSTTALGSTSTAGTGSTGTAGATDTGTGSSTGAVDSDSASESSTGAGALEIAGEWLEEFSPGMSITHVIDEARWDQLSEFGDAVFHVDSYDNEARNVVAQADGANEFSPGLYSRFDWTWSDDDALYYCTAIFDAETAEDALAGPATDPGDLDTGCGGFPWSLLMPVR